MNWLSNHSLEKKFTTLIKIIPEHFRSQARCIKIKLIVETSGVNQSPLMTRGK